MSASRCTMSWIEGGEVFTATRDGVEAVFSRLEDALTFLQDGRAAAAFWEEHRQREERARKLEQGVIDWIPNVRWHP